MQNTNEQQININSATQGVAEEQQFIITITIKADNKLNIKRLAQTAAKLLEQSNKLVAVLDVSVDIWTDDAKPQSGFEPDGEPSVSETNSCYVCGKQTPVDDLYWENPNLPFACQLVCENCLPKDPEDTDAGSWCDEESDAERNR